MALCGGLPLVPAARRPATIPELSLPELAQSNVLQRPDALAYSLATISPSAALLHFPFRLGSYCISLCRQGSTELRTDLAHYRVQPNSLLVLAQGEDIITIPGTKRVGRLEENLAAE